jgi:hypothetical protein
VPAKVAETVGSFAISANARFLAHLMAAKTHKFTFAPDSRAIGYLAATGSRTMRARWVAPLPEDPSKDLGRHGAELRGSTGREVGGMGAPPPPIFFVDPM